MHQFHTIVAPWLARGRGQLSFDNPDVAIVRLFYTIVTVQWEKIEAVSMSSLL